MPVAVITGASRGLGRALTFALAERGWTVVIDARGPNSLREVQARTGVVAIPGDVTDPTHRLALMAAAKALGGCDLLVNNASHLGPSPQPRLVGYPLEELRRVYEADLVAPLALAQLALATAAMIINISSDAAVEAYENWGGYGSAKSALDQVSAVLGVEHPDVRVYAFDPGDMRTQLQQLAFPGEDISDRPEPETVVPALLRLLDERPPSGRIRAADLAAAGTP